MGEEVGVNGASQGMLPRLEKKSSDTPIAELGLLRTTARFLEAEEAGLNLLHILFGGYWSNYNCMQQNASNDRWSV
jgi:hypothetical protein